MDEVTSTGAVLVGAARLAAVSGTGTVVSASAARAAESMAAATVSAWYPAQPVVAAVSSRPAACQTRHPLSAHRVRQGGGRISLNRAQCPRCCWGPILRRPPAPASQASVSPSGAAGFWPWAVAGRSDLMLHRCDRLGGIHPGHLERAGQVVVGRGSAPFLGAGRTG